MLICIADIWVDGIECHGQLRGIRGYREIPVRLVDLLLIKSQPNPGIPGQRRIVGYLLQ
jgi:hypothetical protein